MKPLLSSPYDPALATWPMLVSTKLDGIRALIIDGVVVSRSLKPIPNQHVQALFGKGEYNGLDGELIVGEANDPNVYLKTNSGVMTRTGEPDVFFHVFDDFSEPSLPFSRRILDAQARATHPRMRHLVQTRVGGPADAESIYQSCLNLGFEGIMLRKEDAPYKFGRSTAREGILLKHKPLADSDAVVLDVFEQMHNGNEATTNALGHTTRSSHQENKVGKGTTGGFVARDIHSGIEFNVGIFKGATDADRKEWWINKPIGKHFKYQSLSIGVKDRPRHPRWISWRSELDISN